MPPRKLDTSSAPCVEKTPHTKIVNHWSWPWKVYEDFWIATRLESESNRSIASTERANLRAH